MTAILHLSDLHYSEDYHRTETIYSPLMAQMDFPLQQLDWVLEKTDRQYDAVLLSGDICEYGTEEEYRRVHDLLSERFGCPVIVTCGNHDNLKELIDGFGLRTINGELFEVHQVGDVRIICLNSGNPEYNDGFISQASCDLLEQELKTEVPKTIIMTHHHLLSDQFSLPCAAYPDRLKGIIERSSVMAVVTGHTHHFYEGSFAGKRYLTSGSLSFVVDADETGKLLFYQSPSALEYLIDEDLRYRILDPQKDVRPIGYLPIGSD